MAHQLLVKHRVLGVVILFIRELDGRVLVLPLAHFDCDGRDDWLDAALTADVIRARLGHLLGDQPWLESAFRLLFQLLGFHDLLHLFDLLRLFDFEGRLEETSHFRGQLCRLLVNYRLEGAAFDFDFSLFLSHLRLVAALVHQLLVYVAWSTLGYLWVGEDLRLEGTFALDFQRLLVLVLSLLIEFGSALREVLEEFI